MSYKKFIIDAHISKKNVNDIINNMNYFIYICT